MIADLVLWSGISLLVYAFYKWATINNDYFEKRGVSYKKPSFLVGNNGGFLFLRRYTILEFLNNFYTCNPGYKILGAFNFRTPTLILRDPEKIKQLTVKDFVHFEDRQNIIDEKVGYTFLDILLNQFSNIFDSMYEHDDVLLGNSLFFLKGSKWRDMRATLSPAFSGSKMRQMFDLVSDCGYQMAQTIMTQVRNTGSVDFEMKDLFSKYSSDVISSAAFGCKVNSFEDPNNEFYLSGKKFTQFGSVGQTLRMIMLLTAPKVASFLNITLTDSKITKFFRSMVLENMESRNKENIFRPDMINILMNVKKGNSLSNTTEEKISEGFATVEESSIGSKVIKRVWTDDELISQCLLFFLAGFETSSTLLAFIAYELCINPDIQQKLYEEVVETHNSLGDKKLTYDVVQKMKYMDMVVTETLRYWPPAPAIDRTCVQDYDYDDGQCKFKIEKGTVVTIPICSIHFDEKYWNNPRKFIPERFSDENKDNITPGTYLPFGTGPRNCIGSRFALMEAKAVIYYLILNFEFAPNEQSQIPLKLKKSPIAMPTEKGVHVRLKKRY